MFSYEVNLLCSNEDCCEYLVSEPQEEEYDARDQVLSMAKDRGWSIEHYYFKQHFCPTCRTFSVHEEALPLKTRLELVERNIKTTDAHLSLPELPAMVVVKIGKRKISLGEQQLELVKQIEYEKKNKK